ncbi:MAG: Holliday junction resolvase RuvX [Clostridia bacterium]|nr:Holliday junction resolvase RuvX [Clostridia bacterium]
MKIVSIDYGKARIGMARSDALGMLASPIGTIHEKNFRIQLEKVAEIIKTEKAEKVVYGLPLNMDGSEGETAALVREFAEKMEILTDVPYEFIDERLSTVSAHRILNDVSMSGSKKRKNVVDTVSAVILLQAYLDKN